MEDSIQENTKFLQNEGKKERFIVKSLVSREILAQKLWVKIFIFEIFLKIAPSGRHMGRKILQKSNSWKSGYKSASISVTRAHSKAFRMKQFHFVNYDLRIIELDFRSLMVWAIPLTRVRILIIYGFPPTYSLAILDFMLNLFYNDYF